MRKRKFLQNAAVLTFTSLLLRAVGMYFRIYISGVIGAEGMGVYQMILSVYTLASGFAASGIPVAVTRLTAGALACSEIKKARDILIKCINISLAFALVSGFGIFFAAEMIGGNWLSDSRSILSIKIMAGALPFMAVSCCLRGWFTARRKVGVSSRSQIAEQAVRIALSVALLNIYADKGITYSCAVIMLADALSEGAGCFYAAVGYLIDRRRLKDGAVGENIVSYKTILDIVAPVTMSHYLTTLLHTVESIPLRFAL